MGGLLEGSTVRKVLVEKCRVCQPGYILILGLVRKASGHFKSVWSCRCWAPHRQPAIHCSKHCNSRATSRWSNVSDRGPTHAKYIGSAIRPHAGRKAYTPSDPTQSGRSEHALARPGFCRT